jgi:hypothetical protein
MISMRMCKNCSVWYHEACIGLIKDKIWIICVVHASESCFYLSILEENDVLLTFIENLMGGPY